MEFFGKHVFPFGPFTRRHPFYGNLLVNGIPWDRLKKTLKNFAVNYKDDISPLAKVIIIAEEVATNILIDSHGNLNKYEMDKEAMINLLSEKFRNHTYKKIIQAFEEVTL